ncbi:hypothetical protein SAMN05518801_11755 [Novosphingobium sp. CF614]|uniref:hypothetical protein n=1 Tax=Novosphingobium sp. CF614 TaxID=1884364 RepID=UPI0008F0D23D|nr:hypothetical protein [Novosphingobium sp. CF614]SFG33467.1 hypothetical protein SAMN05518801_11755 [Novosphingobium sp. CF614]
MHKSWPYILGAAIYALVPVGPNEFAKGLWGIPQEAPLALPTSAASAGVGPQGNYTPELLAARERYLADRATGRDATVESNFQSSIPLSPAERAANAILSNPKMTLRDIAVASQILNGQASPRSIRYPGHTTPSYSSAPTQRGSDYGPAHRPVDEASGMGSVSARGTGGAGYRGLSGSSYKYDLSDPGQQMRYEMDPMAQMQDSISIDPRRDIDRSIGQYGGGIEP